MKPSQASKLSTNSKQYKIGQQVLLVDGKTCTIKDIKKEEVTIQAGRKAIFSRLYFKEKHQPEYDWRVVKIEEEIK